MRKEFYFTSSCGNTEIRAMTWKPSSEPKAILQISHGMAEHILRYDEFAQYLCARGYFVVGSDHLGHGKSISSPENYGYFSSKQGNHYLIEDMQLLREKISKDYPNLPYFILGHSMGSTLLRQYILRYGSNLDGAIFSGIVAHQNSAILNVAKCLSKLIGTFKGEHYRSKLLDSLVFGKFNKMMENPKTTRDWVTRDESKLEEYIKDKLCGFIFTTNGYYNVFDGLLRLNAKENKDLLPKELPMLIVSGSQDPVGGFEPGIRDVYERYKRDGAKDISLKIYKDARHEVLNEINREEVYRDIGEWMRRL